jgi:hypothetical protein
MTPQDTYANFAQAFSGVTGRLSLREWEGTIHAYPMRGFKRNRVVIIPGTPLCGNKDVRYIKALAMPTADAPNCEPCLAQMRRALGRE